ncbi:hypothetical protein HOLleu_13701 [Holothuria leucospilota]|uniref:Uncharacterized protein n=1 Tax=Holothuria leucospilota TaxID=206669 RepID=A0A9Q1C734_HOLLE|nr:hypothetical protein HOLleu_13701 [Holothuria leucospilota]
MFKASLLALLAVCACAYEIKDVDVPSLKKINLVALNSPMQVGCISTKYDKFSQVLLQMLLI